MNGVQGSPPHATPGGARPPRPGKKPEGLEIKPLMPQRPGGSTLLRMFLLGLLAVGAYGGYYGYCRYKVNDLKWAFAQQYQDLYMSIMRRSTKIKGEDVRQVVLQMAKAAGVGVVKGTLEVSIEPMDETNEKKLTAMAKTGLQIAASIPKVELEPYVVGFTGKFYASHGPASETYQAERYTVYKATLIHPSERKK